MSDTIDEIKAFLAEQEQDFKKILGGGSGQKKTSSYVGGGKAYDDGGVRLAIMPAGEHQMRLFKDSAGKPFRFGQYHRCKVDDKIIISLCPNLEKKLHPEEDYPETCIICWFAKTFPKDYGLKYNMKILFYAQLYETNVPNDKYWKPGSIYKIEGPKKMFEYYNNLLTGLSKGGAVYLDQYLSPDSSGDLTTVKYVKGSIGVPPVVNMVPMPGTGTGQDTKIKTGDWYVPLEDVYIPKTFDLGKYNKIVDFLKIKYKEALDKMRAEQQNPQPVQPSNPQATETNVQETAPAQSADVKTNPTSLVSDKECFGKKYNPEEGHCAVCEVSYECHEKITGE